MTYSQHLVSILLIESNEKRLYEVKNIRWDFEYVDISILNDETIESVVGLAEGSDEVLFITKSKKAVALYHIQRCSATIDLHSFECDIDDFRGAVVIDAECVETVKLVKSRHKSENWSFYRINTTKGSLVLRWCGDSYYSDEVSVVSGVVVE